jgi:uncharacterized membrane protein YgcG
MNKTQMIPQDILFIASCLLTLISLRGRPHYTRGLFLHSSRVALFRCRVGYYSVLIRVMKQTLLFYSLLLCFCGSTGVIPSSAQRIALRSSEQLRARSDRHANYVPPTRTVAEKRSPRRGGGGGDGGGSGGSGSGSGGSSCTPTTEVTLDRSPGAGSQISRGYGTHTSEGPGA